MESNFTLTSGSVDGFKSTWDTEGAEKEVTERGIVTETIKTSEQATNCEEYSASISVIILVFLSIFHVCETEFIGTSRHKRTK